MMHFVHFQVSVFGYGADKQGNWHHYWEENRYAGAFRKTGVHSADFETEVIHTLNKEGKIKLYPWHLHEDWRIWYWTTKSEPDVCCICFFSNIGIMGP